MITIVTYLFCFSQGVAVGFVICSPFRAFFVPNPPNALHWVICIFPFQGKTILFFNFPRRCHWVCYRLPFQGVFPRRCIGLYVHFPFREKPYCFSIFPRRCRWVCYRLPFQGVFTECVALGYVLPLHGKLFLFSTKGCKPFIY